MHRRFLPILAILMGVLPLTGGPVPPAALAQTPETVGIRIVDAPSSRSDDPRAKLYIVDHVAPGTTITRRVEVNNGTSKPQTIQLYAASAEVAGGVFQFGEGRAANDLTRWTTVNPSSVSLAAGAKGLATVTIAVPPKATAGEQYGVVWAELSAAAPAGGGIAAVNRVGVRMYLSVGPGGEPPTEFEVTTLQGQRAADGSPVVAATVHNTGGRAIDLSGELRLTGGPGGLSAGPFNATLGTTLGVGQAEPVLVTLDKALPAGPWQAKIVLRSGTTEREGGASVTFPAQASTKSPAAKASSGDGSGPPVVAGAVVLGLLVIFGIFLVLSRRRRRGADSKEPGEVETPQLQ
jgi:hypothetical protein